MQCECGALSPLHLIGAVNLRQLQIQLVGRSHNPVTDHLIVVLTVMLVNLVIGIRNCMDVIIAIEYIGGQGHVRHIGHLSVDFQIQIVINGGQQFRGIVGGG